MSATPNDPRVVLQSFYEAQARLAKARQPGEPPLVCLFLGNPGTIESKEHMDILCRAFALHGFGEIRLQMRVK